MYEVNSKLEVTNSGWRQVEIQDMGFTNKGAMHYNVVDTKGQKIIKIYIYPSVKIVKAFQGKHRQLTFKWSDGIDGNSTRDIIQKVINFLMW